jgi:hypothetical protein
MVAVSCISINGLYLLANSFLEVPYRNRNCSKCVNMSIRVEEAKNVYLIEYVRRGGEVDINSLK